MVSVNRVRNASELLERVSVANANNLGYDLILSDNRMGEGLPTGLYALTELIEKGYSGIALLMSTDDLSGEAEERGISFTFKSRLDEGLPRAIAEYQSRVGVLAQ